MHKSQRLFYLTTALYVSGVTITHFQEHNSSTIAADNSTVYRLPDAVVTV